MIKKLETSLPNEITDAIRDGTELAGDSLSESQLALWFSQEQEAFFESDAGESELDPWYAYMRYVNEAIGFSALKGEVDSLDSALVLGPGAGTEIERFARNHPNCKISFIESSANFQNQLKERFAGARVLSPHHSGRIGLPEASQALVCAFSVLHHIPNVGFVVKELGRVTKPGGVLMIREPCSSMGDWREPRSATPNERGISRDLLIAFAEQAGFHLERKPIPIIWEPINKLLKKVGFLNWIPFGAIYGFDRVCSWMLAFNDHYWRDSLVKKFGPSSYFYLFRKNSADSVFSIENKPIES